MLLKLLQKAPAKEVKNLPEKELKKEVKVENQIPAINWEDPTQKISKYFTVKEALYLPSWNCYHVPTEEEKTNILFMAKKMDIVREFLNAPINIHCWIRPDKVNCVGFDPKTVKADTPAKQAALAALDYNAFVGGAKASMHRIGSAVDWSAKNIKCDDARTKLIPKLEEYDLRMEDLKGSNWVHLDCRKPINNVRFFKP